MDSVWIILVNYNGYEDTIECIRSLKNVKYNNFKIVVVDNCSVNRSYEVLSKIKDEQIILLKNENNTGFAGGCNFGIRYALENNADYIMLLNNDTIVDSNVINELIGSIKSNNDVAMVGGKIYYYNSDEIWFANGHYNTLTCKVKHYTKESKQPENTNFLTGCLQLISIQAIKKVGLLSEKYFMYYEDVEFCNRLIRNGYKLVYNPSAIIYHKCGKSSDYKSANAQYYSNRARYIFIQEQKNRKALLLLYCELLLKYILYYDERKEGLKMLFKYIMNRKEK